MFSVLIARMKYFKKKTRKLNAIKTQKVAKICDFVEVWGKLTFS